MPSAPHRTTTSLESPIVLPGRDELRRDLLAIVGTAANGFGSATTLVAEPGVGKTAVLDAVVADVRRARPDVTIVTLSGVEAELELAWAGLHALLRPLDRARARLSGPRRYALAAALTEVEPSPDEHIDPFAVALATHDVLVAAAERAPILVVVDDVHWLDHSSRRTLAFVARRIGLERIAIVAARRPETGVDLDLGPTRVLPALDPAAATEVVAGAGVSNPAVRQRILAAGAGNPLVLRSISLLLDDDQRAGRTPLPDPLRVGLTAERLVDHVLAGLAEPDRLALLVAAAEGTGDRAAVTAAIVQLGVDPAVLDGAERARVVALTPTQVRFRHPLYRSAIYHGAPDADRRAAHRALADSARDRAAAGAWHRALATVGRDDEVAADLDHAAEAALRGVAPATAGQLWELAGRLSEDDAGRVVRLRRSAAAFVDAGQPVVASSLLDRAERLADGSAAATDDLERYERLRVRVRLPDGDGGESLGRLIEGARTVARHRPALAADLVTDAAAIAIREVAWESLLELVPLAGGLVVDVDGDRADRLEVLGGLVATALGDPSAPGRLERWRRLAEPDRAPAHAGFLAGVVAPALAFLRRLDAADELLDQLEPVLRARGAHADLGVLLSARAMGQYGRSLPATLQATTDALAVADATGTAAPLNPASVQAIAAAAVGDRVALDEAVAALRRDPEGRREVAALVGLGFAALVDRRLDEADAHYTRLETIAPIGTWVNRWEPEWIETLIRAGRREAAEALLRRFEQALGPSGPSPVAGTGLERVRGMLADDTEADEHFARSVALGEESRNAVAIGRTETAWGERLRRARHRSEARRHLERARTALRDVGATALAELAERELVAAGGTLPTETGSHPRLTAHELRVARLTVAGSSNRQLADQLFVSPRTVEAHLSAIFRKLGVANRRELAALALEHAFLRP